MKKPTKHLIFFVLVVFALLVLSFFYYNRWTKTDYLYYNSLVYINQLEKLTGVGRLQSQHIHADFKIFINGKFIDINEEKYQAPEFGTVEFWETTNFSKFTHLHSGIENEGVIHVHATGVTLGMFLHTIGFELNYPCLVLNGKFCNEKSKTVKVLVNKEEIPNPRDYIIQDLDKILISYGFEDKVEVLQQFNTIMNNSCIQSAKC